MRMQLKTTKKQIKYLIICLSDLILVPNLIFLYIDYDWACILTLVLIFAISFFCLYKILKEDRLQQKKILEFQKQASKFNYEVSHFHYPKATKKIKRNYIISVLKTSCALSNFEYFYNQTFIFSKKELMDLINSLPLSITCKSFFLSLIEKQQITRSVYQYHPEVTEVKNQLIQESSNSNPLYSNPNALFDLTKHFCCYFKITSKQKYRLFVGSFQNDDEEWKIKSTLKFFKNKQAALSYGCELMETISRKAQINQEQFLQITDYPQEVQNYNRYWHAYEEESLPKDEMIFLSFYSAIESDGIEYFHDYFQYTPDEYLPVLNQYLDEQLYSIIEELASQKDSLTKDQISSFYAIYQYPSLKLEEQIQKLANAYYAKTFENMHSVLLI